MKHQILKAGHAAWRLLPREFRRNAMSGIAAALTRKPDAVPPAKSDGIVVAGDMAGANGLAESARIMHDVFAAHGLARGSMNLGLPSVVPAFEGTISPHAALLAVVNAPILPVGLSRLPRDILRHRRVIGMWVWELPVVPKQWHYAGKFVHEVWAPSQFCADAMQAIVPGRVRVVPYPVATGPLPFAGDRNSFGLPQDKIIVLTIFNLASSMVRKNPLAAIAAFKAAFGDNDNYLFVMKLSGVRDYADDLALIRTAVGAARNIQLMTETLPEPELRGLIAVSDIILSLHRAEGFGLIPATAMLLGRPVIATGWSGNVDFMTPETSILVSHKLVPVIDPRGTYEMPGALWAEPDIEDAAAGLRKLADDPALRARLGAAGQAYARLKLGAEPVLAAAAANGIV
ncbi:MAG: glycosyl transferase family 1 [Acidiphilium sp. 21-62-4]|nr:MAG: glycosyl transferase family 1 [Acidocella sp. 20-57-95]OYV63267.1 MAG: glycosyl transferase family 1 [Acidiphilium sp. 21-62-4]HQT65217.1 glycosyltransferase [Acidocella sp.]